MVNLDRLILDDLLGGLKNRGQRLARGDLAFLVRECFEEVRKVDQLCLGLLDARACDESSLLCWKI